MYSEHAVQQSNYNVTTCIKMQVHKQIRTINTAHQRIGARLARGFNDDTIPNQTQVHLCAACLTYACASTYQYYVHTFMLLKCMRLCVCMCVCLARVQRVTDRCDMLRKSHTHIQTTFYFGIGNVEK